jgi:transposase InsO family protein
VNDEERREAWALFRHNVIAPLLETGSDGAEKAAKRKEILAGVHITPDGKKWTISERTLRNWLARHRSSQLKGLKNQRHENLGVMTALDEQVLEQAKGLRERMRTRSIPDILLHLKMRGVDVSGISTTTLNRHLNRVGATKRKDFADRGAFQHFAKEHINQLWQTDCSDGLWLPDPMGLKEVRQTTLITFIDDCSRFCVHGQFFWTAQLVDLLYCFKAALLARGKPGTTYSDNGSIYRARDWSAICGELDIGVKHSEPYRPPGKGKQERHYLTIQRRFYKEAEKSGLMTLQELNEFFWAWLEQCYHQGKHKGIGMPPLERWQMEEHLVERLSLETLEQKMQRRAYRDVDFKTALIRLNGKRYQASQGLAGEKRVQLRWPFDDESAVNIWRKGVLTERANLFVAGADIDYSKRPVRKQDAEPKILDCAKQLRLSMVSRRRGEMMPADTSKYGFLTQSEFAFVLESCLSRTFNDSEMSLLNGAYERLSPLDAEFVQDCLARAVASKGAQKHLNFYLTQMEEAKTRR